MTVLSLKEGKKREQTKKEIEAEALIAEPLLVALCGGEEDWALILGLRDLKHIDHPSLMKRVGLEVDELDALERDLCKRLALAFIVVWKARKSKVGLVEERFAVRNALDAGISREELGLLKKEPDKIEEEIDEDEDTAVQL